MSTRKFVAAVVLLIAIGAAIAGFIRSTEMPQQTTITEILDQTARSAVNPNWLRSLLRTIG